MAVPNSDVKTSRDTSTLGRGRGRGGDRRTESTRGRGGAKTSSLVQTSGLFSEGTGEAKMRRSSSGKTELCRILNIIVFIF